MGFLSWLTDPINHLFGGHAGEDHTDPLASAIAAQTDATKAASAKASADAAAALKAQQDANLIAAANSTPAVDNESAQAAADAKRRKLMAGSNFGIGLPTAMGAPPVGFRLLSGQ